MTCRHPSGYHDYEAPAYVAPPATPDATNYTLEEIERIGNHLVLKVKYPNCRDCSYEGSKVMVFLNVTEKQALKWRKIDPHFKDPRIKIPDTTAPAPAARFPASPEGWADAVTYARGKGKSPV